MDGYHSKLIQGIALELDLNCDDFSLKTDFINTGWYHDGILWVTQFKNELEPLPLNEILPSIKSQCYCGKKIKKNYLIRHRHSGKLIIVGCVCIKKVGFEMRKTCIDCGKIHKKKTSRCGECRVFCFKHKDYHPNNFDCVNLEFITNGLENVINFGKYKGKRYKEVLLKDKGYLKWLVRENIREHKKWLEPYLLETKS